MLLLLHVRPVHPDGLGRAAGIGAGGAQSVAIVPDVAGEVIEVPVAANTPLKAGDVLFRIDPVPFESQVKAIAAQLKLAETRLAQMTQLFERDSGRGFDVEQRQAEVDQLKAQLEGAQWNLDKTDGAGAGRRLRDQPRAAQGRAGRQPAAVAGDGLHRHIETPSSASRSPRSMRATSRRASRSR